MSERRKVPLAVRFWRKVRRRGARCWLWRGARTSEGYGAIRDGDGRVVYAHRVAFALLVGPVPDDLVTDHVKCGRRECVNPAHLEMVTREENTRRGNATRWKEAA